MTQVIRCLFPSACDKTAASCVQDRCHPHLLSHDKNEAAALYNREVEFNSCIGPYPVW